MLHRTFPRLADRFGHGAKAFRTRWAEIVREGAVPTSPAPVDEGQSTGRASA
jgi:hypothetical protein